MAHIPKVLVCMAMNDEGNRKKLAGIFDYIRESRPWDVSLIDPSAQDVSPCFRPDGIIAGEWPFSPTRFGKTPKVIMHLPGNNLSLSSYVTCDNRAVVSAALGLLRQHGFKSFAYIHDKAKTACSRERHAAMGGRSWPESGYNDISGWLRALPQRTAILAADDTVAREAMLKCRTLGIRIPRDLAFVGIDNDELLCEACATALTSVEPDFRSGGYLAARQLDTLMSGETIGARILHYGVRRVVERDSSTYITRGGDPRLDAALAFIRKHATESIGISEIAKSANVSRRTLEYMFKKQLKRPVGKILRLARLDAIMSLIKSSQLTISEICAQSGFLSESHAKRAFKERFGKPMSAFRPCGK